KAAETADKASSKAAEIADKASSKAAETADKASSKAEEIAGEANSKAVETASGAEEEANHFPAFAVEDLEGKKVTEEAFASANLTVVNIWGTFCGPCIREMPSLGELATELAPEGVQFLGIVCDVSDQYGNVYPEQVAEAKQIVEETGAGYTHLVPTGGLMDLIMETQYVPTTYFVDGQGRILGEPLVGSRSKEEWLEVIRDGLQK
ncbi:MAG: redoxin domain-containing protein, partial [Lachnospiraceae bacterium]